MHVDLWPGHGHRFMTNKQFRDSGTCFPQREAYWTVGKDLQAENTAKKYTDGNESSSKHKSKEVDQAIC